MPGAGVADDEETLVILDAEGKSGGNCGGVDDEAAVVAVEVADAVSKIAAPIVVPVAVALVVCGGTMARLGEVEMMGIGGDAGIGLPALMGKVFWKENEGAS